jgi:N-acyl-D-amino-acid deacylase
VAAIAKERGEDPLATLYDLMLEDNAGAMLMMPFFNYAEGNHDAIYDMISHPAAVSGLSDGGAHCGLICDASYPTYLLTHWARDRHRGPRFSLEYMVRKQTRDTATLFGLSDRGVIELGKRADVNVIDMDALNLGVPQMVYDLPAGGRRLVQGARGYDATVVNGVVTRWHGVDTGARPGRLPTYVTLFLRAHDISRHSAGRTFSRRRVPERWRRRDFSATRRLLRCHGS